MLSTLMNFFFNSSIINMTEATLVINICKVLLKSINCSQIGIITPYKAQERLIRTELKEK